MRKVNKGILLCSILFLVTILGMSVYASYPELHLKSCLNKQDYKNAVNIYNNHFADTKEADSYQEIFLSEIKEIKEQWKEGNLTYKDAETWLSNIAEILQNEIAAEAKRMKEFIVVEGQAEECYENARVYFENGEYVDALKQIAKIDESSLEYSKVKNFLETCVSAILEQTKALNSVEEYENWIQKLESYYEIVPEAAFLTRKAQLEQEVTVFKDVIDIVKKAADSYRDASYKNAFDILESGLEKYPDSERMNREYKQYHSQYVSKVKTEVEELCEKEEYNRALEEVESAREAHDCKEFQELTEYVKEEKSILYKWKNNIVDFFYKLKK